MLIVSAGILITGLVIGIRPELTSIFTSILILQTVAIILARKRCQCSLMLMYSEEVQVSYEAYPSITQNFQPLIALLQPGFETEDFIFLFGHGLHVPWDKQPTQRLLSFVERCADVKPQITSENGFHAPGEVVKEIDCLRSRVNNAVMKRIQCVLVLVGGRNSMQEYNGFF